MREATAAATTLPAFLEGSGDAGLRQRQIVQVRHVQQPALRAPADILGDADTGGIFAGQDARPRWRADGARRVGPCEPHAAVFASLAAISKNSRAAGVQSALSFKV
jgi:hypothetical protein